MIFRQKTSTTDYLGTEELYDKWVTEIDAARFYLKAMEGLMQEFENLSVFDNPKPLWLRHKAYSQAVSQHIRTASRIRRKIERIEKKAGKTDGERRASKRHSRKPTTRRTSVSGT